MFYHAHFDAILHVKKFMEKCPMVIRIIQAHFLLLFLLMGVLVYSLHVFSEETTSGDRTQISPIGWG